jgi:hypothetical protein
MRGRQAVIITLLLVGWTPGGAAQAPASGPRTVSARASAPIDLIGDWVSVVTEDWRWRMQVPPKGDYTSVPLNAAGRREADGWDPASAATDGCRAFGAAAIMRVPGRLRITWESDTVLRIEADAGRQTRRLRFEGQTPDSAERTWQGLSTAQWEPAGGGRGRGTGPGAGRGARGQGDAQEAQGARGRGGSLKVTTTQMRAGYLRANGVPYSEQAVVTEYFDRHQTFGDEWLTVTTIVEDPEYLTQPFITSSDFKREADGAMFAPAPCE